MIKRPFSDELYAPTVREILGDFDIYDREHTLGLELEKYDINVSADRRALAKQFILKSHDYLTYRHKFLLMAVLVSALEEESYDFQALLEHDCESTNCFPEGWDQMDRPRSFFEDIHAVLSQAWQEQLLKASLEDQSTW